MISGAEHDTVKADLHFGDLAHAIGLAALILRGVHAARGIGDVRLVKADTGTEQTEAAARTGRFDNRRGETRLGAEGFGDRGREREDRRGSNDTDLVALLGLGAGAKRQDSGEGCKMGGDFHASDSLFSQRR